METGFLVIAAIALVWPLTATVVTVASRPPRARRYRPFLWSALAGAGTGIALWVYAVVLLATNGTSQSMASLGPQIGGAACIAGALVSAVVAAVLRVTARTAAQSTRDQPTPDERPGSERSHTPNHPT